MVSSLEIVILPRVLVGLMFVTCASFMRKCLFVPKSLMAKLLFTFMVLSLALFSVCMLACSCAYTTGYSADTVAILGHCCS